MEKMFGAVKLEDLEKADSAGSPDSETPKMGAVKMGEIDDKPTEDVEPAEETPKMGEQKEAPKPVETFVPKIPGADKDESTEDDDKGLDATSFRMDMMVEADEEIDSTKGIFSGAQPTSKGVTPIRSAIFQQDDVNFKGKTATHAETVFDTDQTIKEEQKEKEKVEENEKTAETGAKRANKAWGVGTGDAAAEAAEDAKEEADKVKAGKMTEEKKPSAPTTPVKTESHPQTEEQAEEAAAKETAAKEPVKDNLTTEAAEATLENASTGIFTAKPKKGSFINKIFGNIQAVFNKPIGKKPEK